MEQIDLSGGRLPRIPLALMTMCMVVSLLGVADIAGSQRQKAQEPKSAQLSPVVPGLHGQHPLNEREVGALLMGELNCAACHSQLEILNSRTKTAPDLNDVGGRVSPEFLRRFIANPADAQPGTTMPQMLHGISSKKRDEVAGAISEYLISQSSSAFHRDPVGSSSIDSGRELFHKVGCVACHAPREAATVGASIPMQIQGAIGLEHLPLKYSLESLSQFLHQPLQVRPSGRMPDMGLNLEEAESIASYLLGAEQVSVEQAPSRPSLVEAGREYFQALNCAECHSMEGVEAQSPVAKKESLNPDRGCLSSKPVGVPDFSLSESQRSSLRTAIQDGDFAQSASDQVAVTLTTFNCISCHLRDDYGGVQPEVNLYFKTSEPSLGEDARIPPRLTEVGAKLKSDWFHRVMFDSASVRPYMHTRMPQFGEANLATLWSQLESADPPVAYEMPNPKGEQAKEFREAGKALLGAGTLGCINCHTFNGKASPAFNGIDLITAVERLRPDWFSRFLIDPQKMRPGIIMPQGWPGGIATRSDILEGSTKAQIDAIWFYLSQGRTARDPKGIRSEPTVLAVTDTTRTYRGRSRIAGFRGIAVGFPGGINYAFNANNGVLSGIWQGNFVRVRWDGQGAGDFDPASRAIAMAQDVGFCSLANDDAPWPLRPKMDEENPVNPDPLYPRNVGYQFGGYYFDEQSIPTFMYRMGDVAIEDKSVHDAASKSRSMKRSIRFSTDVKETLYFRVLAGKVEAVTPTQFKTDSLQITIPAIATLLRPLEGADGPTELILKIEIPQGESTIVINYEVL